MEVKMNKFRSIVTKALLGAALFYPAGAHAHVRWFVDSASADAVSFQPYALSEPAVLAWVLIAIALIGTAVFLDVKLPTVAVPNTKLRHDVMELMRVLTGMSLLLTAYEGSLIAPHLQAVGGFGLALLFVQASVGILLLSNHFLHHAALLLLLMFLGMMVHLGVARSFEYINFVGIALFVLFNTVPDTQLREQLKPYSVDVLRIFTGLSLIILGISEKLHPTALGHVFISDYAWNFMPLLGFEWFDDRLFVLSAGVMEVVFGAILVLGVVTRLNILAVAVLMLTSNIVFLFENRNTEALVELVGHLPIIATALVLLVLGYGQRLKVTPKQVPNRGHWNFANLEGRT
jgi:uncharacterized membrane protein YphA (DoxX/SURF4 family)